MTQTNTIVKVISNQTLRNNSQYVTRTDSKEYVDGEYIYIPPWAKYIEIAIVAAVAMLVVGVAGSICKRLCCPAVGGAGGNGEERRKAVIDKKQVLKEAMKRIHVTTASGDKLHSRLKTSTSRFMERQLKMSTRDENNIEW